MIDFNKYTKRTAQQIWDKDKRAVETFKKAGYNVIIIWESDI